MNNRKICLLIPWPDPELYNEAGTLILPPEPERDAFPQWSLDDFEVIDMGFLEAI